MSNPTNSTQGGFNLSPSDITFIISRHRWKIILLTLAGLIGAAGYYLSVVPEYISIARLYIRYVQEGQEIDVAAQGTTHKFIDREGVLTSEIQIMKSLDLAKEAAIRVGPERILDLPKSELQKLIEKVVGEKEKSLPNDAEKRAMTAAMYVQGKTEADPVSESTVIKLTFAHPNPAVLQPVLDTIIEEYRKRHLQTHGRAEDMDDLLASQKDQRKQALQGIEEQLRRLRNEYDIISLENERGTQASEISRLKGSILATEAELAERRSSYGELQKLRSEQETSFAAEDAEAEQQAAASAEATAPAPLGPMDATVAGDYEQLKQRLGYLRNRETQLSVQFTGENKIVQGVREQIDATAKKIAQFESNYPVLLGMADGGTGGAQRALINVENARINVLGLETRLKVLREQLIAVRKDVQRISKVEAEIQDLERRRNLESDHYEYFLRNLEESRIDAELGLSKTSGITVIQSPTPALSQLTDTFKIMGIIAAVGLGVGIGWAFLIELVLDRTVKRSVDIEKGVGVPLFASIPNANTRSYRLLAKGAGKENLRLMAANRAASAEAGHRSTGPRSLVTTAKAVSDAANHYEAPRSNGRDPAPWQTNHALQPYFEALRDRMIGYFDSKNLTHRPKMIGFTGLGENPGVSTVAGGLAGSLSQFGEGNVLLVDMNLGQESAHQFYQGRAVRPLSDEPGPEDTAQIEENLYVVAEGTNGFKLPRIDPKRFTDLVTRLKTSDFDYIIFDMPAVSPISSTPRLARSMDAVMLVVESEKTDRDVVQKATALLQESNTHVGAILNKTRIYAPDQLKQDFFGSS